MKNVLITIFFILSFAPMFAQTVPEKEIDFEGSFIMDDARSASLPIEAYLQDTQVVITFYVDLSDATVTIASEENNQEMEERTISFIDSAPEVFNISGYSKGTYIITITTPRGTYLLLLFMFFCLLFTCKEAEKGKNTRLVKVWEGKADAFPSCFICTIQEIDAIHLWKK